MPIENRLSKEERHAILSTYGAALDAVGEIHNLADDDCLTDAAATTIFGTALMLLELAAKVKGFTVAELYSRIIEPALIAAGTPG